MFCSSFSHLSNAVANLGLNVVGPKLNVHYIFLLPRARSLADFEELKPLVEASVLGCNQNYCRGGWTPNPHALWGVLFGALISAIELCVFVGHSIWVYHLHHA